MLKVLRYVVASPLTSRKISSAAQKPTNYAENFFKPLVVNYVFKPNLLENFCQNLATSNDEKKLKSQLEALQNLGLNPDFNYVISKKCEEVFDGSKIFKSIINAEANDNFLAQFHQFSNALNFHHRSTLNLNILQNFEPFNGDSRAAVTADFFSNLPKDLVRLLNIENCNSAESLLQKFGCQKPLQDLARQEAEKFQKSAEKYCKELHQEKISDMQKITSGSRGC
jgi:hypothetical protein